MKKGLTVHTALQVLETTGTIQITVQVCPHMSTFNISKEPPYLPTLALLPYNIFIKCNPLEVQGRSRNSNELSMAINAI